MLRLVVATARTRLAALVAVLCAVLGGAALVTASAVLAESGVRSHVDPGRLAGVDVVVSADQQLHPAQDLAVALPERRGVPASLVGRLAALPGATAVVGDLSLPAAVLDAQGRVVPAGDPSLAGHGWGSVRLLASARVDGRPPTADDEVALDAATARAADVGPGDDVRLVVAGESGTYRVTAVVTDASAVAGAGADAGAGTTTDASGGVGVLLADATAARFAGRDGGPRAGTVDLVALRAGSGGASALADAVTERVAGSGLVVTTGPAVGDAASPGASAARDVLLGLGTSAAGTITLVVGLVTAGAMGIAVAAQRRDLALLRAVGATPRQVRRLAVGQAMLVAVPAAAVGAALGYPLAAWFRAGLVDLGLLPGSLPLHLGPLPALVALALLLPVVALAARGAARRTASAPVVEVVAESLSEPCRPSWARSLAGLVLMALAVPIALPPLSSRTMDGAVGAPLSGLVAAIGLTLAAPVLMRWTGTVLRALLPAGTPAPAWLAVANLRGYAQRGAGAVAALVVVVVFVLTNVLTQTTVAAAAAGEVADATLADTTISAPALGGLPPGLTADAARVPGVLAVAPQTSTTVVRPFTMMGDTSPLPEPATVLDPAAAGVLDLGVREGSLGDLTGASVALGADAAAARSVGVGDHVDLVLGDGTEVSPTVVAVYDRSLGHGPLVLSSDLAAGHTAALADRLLVRTDGTATAHDALAALVSARPGVVVGSTGPGEPGAAGVSPDAWVNLVANGVVLGYVLLGVVNTLVAATVRRRPEVDAMRLVGATPRQVRRTLLGEAGLLAALAAVAGVALSAVPLALLGIGFLGRPWPAGPAWLLPVTVAGAAVLALTATALPVRHLLRRAALA